jgi:hypothetical protein
MNPYFDLSKVTDPTEVRIDGHDLIVRPGSTEGGRYWQLLTTDGVRVGMVAEHWVRVLGRTRQVFEATYGDQQLPALSANAAARLIAQALGVAS